MVKHVLSYLFVVIACGGCGDPQTTDDAGVDSGDGDSGDPTGVLEGRVTFVGSPLPVGRVIIVVHESDSPGGPPSGMSENVGLGADGTGADYQIDPIDLGTHGFIAAYWEDPDDSDISTRYHDLSSGTPPDVEPVILTEEEPEAQRDLTADWSRVDDYRPPPESGTLAGTITFVGDPPEEGTIVVGVFAYYPASGPPPGMTQEMPMGADGSTQSYEIPAFRFGTYDYVAVYWIDPADTGFMTRYHDISTVSEDALEAATFSEESPDVVMNLSADWSLIP